MVSKFLTVISFMYRHKRNIYECAHDAPPARLCQDMGSFVGVLDVPFRKPQWLFEASFSWNQRHDKTGSFIVNLCKLIYVYTLHSRCLLLCNNASTSTNIDKTTSQVSTVADSHKRYILG